MSHLPRFIAFLLWMSLCLVNPLFASEGGGGGGSQIYWQIFSLALLIIVLSFVLKKPVRSFLAKRREQVKNALEQSAKKEQQLAALFREWESKLASLGQEINDLHQKINQEGEIERKRIVDRALEEADRVRKQAQVVSAQELKKARSALKKEMVDLSVELAEELLKQAIQPQDQDRLVRDYIAKMRELR